MGKLGPRLSSAKKAKRWPKGQSSSSNPVTKRYRDATNWMLSTPAAVDKPGLRKEDLQKHDAIQGIEPQFEKLDIDEDRAESTVEGSVDTIGTFASSYSNCSNISFNRFLNHFQSNSILHKEMLAVLSAVTEVIKQNGGIESSTEYFAALMSTLEAIESDTSVAATLSLLGMGLKTVPRNVLNAQFGAASQIFLQILSKYATTENFLIARHCIHCLSILVRALEPAAWISSSTMKVIDAILSFTTHGKPKVRKAAQHAICAILKGSDIMKVENPPTMHPAAPQVAKYCVGVLNTGKEPGGVTSVLHILTLLKDVIHLLPKAHVKTISEGLLSIMTLKNVLLTSCCLQTFYGLFVSRPSASILPFQKNGQIITALYDFQPPKTDTQPILAWLTVMQEAHVNLARISLHTCAAVLPRIFQKCAELWLSNKPPVISGASHVMKVLIQECVSLLCANEEEATKYDSTMNQIISTLRQALSYKYLDAWYHILHLIAVLFEVVGKRNRENVLEIIKVLVDLHESYNFGPKSDAEYAIGAAIKYMDAEIVFKTIEVTDGNNEINLNRTWVLPLFKDCITDSTLSFFINNLLPLTAICEKKSTEPVQGKAYELLNSQIWAILPSICSNATDVKTNFKVIAKTLGSLINDNKNLRSSCMASVRRLIKRAVDNDHKEDIEELAKYAKNYLPILLNLYTIKPQGTDEEGLRRATLDTVEIYLKVTSSELACELFDRAMTRLKEPNVDDFFKESIHDILRVFVQHTNGDRLKLLYDIYMAVVKEPTKMKEEKKAYRFLEDILGSENETCKTFISQHRREIQKQLISTASKVTKPCKTARLKCFVRLVRIHPQLEKTKFLEAIVPEAVVCIKETNTKCRATAFELLNAIADKFLENPEYLHEYIKILMAGMAGAQSYCSSSLLALASITYHCTGALGVETVKEILGFACTLAVSPTREVAEAALSYIKVYITVMPSPTVAVTLSKIIETLSAMNDDCQRHFRQKIRDIFVKLIRKYGSDTVGSMIPKSDTMLRKRLKNITKIEQAKKAKREMKKSQKEAIEDDEFSTKRKPKSMEEILADSDEEYDDENDEPRKTKRKSRKEAWIQENEENIVDLVDPTAARNISTTQPGQLTSQAPMRKKKESEFKTAPDGRLIIEDDGEIDYEEKSKKRKKSSIPLHSDSENEDENDDALSVATETMIGKKRKRTDASDTASMRSYATSGYKAGGSGIHRPIKKGNIEHAPGAEYRSGKAPGDVKKKGKPDPYAYVPLTRSALNKRKKKKNQGKFKSIIKGAKKGAAAGMKNK